MKKWYQHLCIDLLLQLKLNFRSFGIVETCLYHGRVGEVLDKVEFVGVNEQDCDEHYLLGYAFTEDLKLRCLELATKARDRLV
jgi:hypothetical protein